jgi:hypothetical protein
MAPKGTRNVAMSLSEHVLSSTCGASEEPGISYILGGAPSPYIYEL